MNTRQRRHNDRREQERRNHQRRALERRGEIRIHSAAAHESRANRNDPRHGTIAELRSHLEARGVHIESASQGHNGHNGHNTTGGSAVR